MTANNFAALCAELAIAPELALESDEVRAALLEEKRTGKTGLVRAALLEAF